MNKTIYHLHIFFKNKLTHCCFKYSSSICSSWTDRVDFLYFWSSKIHVISTHIVSSLSLLWCRRAATACHISFPWSKDKLTICALSFGNALSYRPPSQAKIETLNPHHRRRPPSSDHLILTLYCYKKIILILVTLLTSLNCVSILSYF
jgi:hypothetical protein